MIFFFQAVNLVLFIYKPRRAIDKLLLIALPNEKQKEMKEVSEIQTNFLGYPTNLSVKYHRIILSTEN